MRSGLNGLCNYRYTKRQSWFITVNQYKEKKGDVRRALALQDERSEWDKEVQRKRV